MWIWFMSRNLPSMTALVAFEAAARHQSFTRAAEELCVTQGAVSHQVKALETELRLRLFSRRPQGIELTVAGSSYFAVIREVLDRIAEGTDTLLKKRNSGVLTVSISPNFAAKWLVQRLGRFTDAFPLIDLRLSATKHHVDFAAEDVDLAVRHAEEPERGLHATKLCEEELFPVCSPKLMEGPNSPRDIGNLNRHTLLHLDNRRDWLKWLDLSGANVPDLSKGPVFDQASMAIDAAVAGQGVALARSGLVAQDLIRGHLIRPFSASLPVSYGYWIVCPRATAALPKIETFRGWLLDEAAEDAKKLAWR